MKPGSIKETLRVGFQHLLSMLPRGFGQLGAAEHSGDLFGAFVSGDQMDGRAGASACGLFFDQVVMIGEGGNLGQVGHAKNLVLTGKTLELLPYRLRRPATDACIDFIENQRPLRP